VKDGASALAAGKPGRTRRNTTGRTKIDSGVTESLDSDRVCRLPSPLLPDLCGDSTSVNLMPAPRFILSGVRMCDGDRMEGSVGLFCPPLLLTRARSPATTGAETFEGRE